MGWKWIKASPGDLPCVWEMSLDEQMGGGGGLWRGNEGLGGEWVLGMRASDGGKVPL